MISSVLGLTGGLGLFLYGMFLMSDSLEKAAGSKLRNILEYLTKNRLMGVLVGTGFTAVIQSSSATTVMVVSFVNAKLMTLAQAAGVIMALMAAGVPTTSPVAGISCGLVTGDSDDDFIVLTDIQGLEDFFGDMDFKVAGTHKGITAIQMDIKIHGLTKPIIEEAIAKTRKARIYIMIIRDHISSFIPSPLLGRNIEELGTRFPDMCEIYDRDLIDILKRSAAEEKIDVREGTYIQLTGPNFETPAEIRMCRALGADAVGMSTAVEAMAANHMRMKICGISCISNMNGHKLGAVGECCLHLHFVDHFGHAFHNVVAGEQVAARPHELGHALPVARAFQHGQADIGHGLGIIELEAARLAPFGQQPGGEEQQLVLFSGQKFHTVSCDCGMPQWFSSKRPLPFRNFVAPAAAIAAAAAPWVARGLERAVPNARHMRRAAGQPGAQQIPGAEQQATGFFHASGKTAVNQVLKALTANAPKTAP